MNFLKLNPKKLILPTAILFLLFGATAVYATERCEATSLAKHEPIIDWPASPLGSSLDASTDIPLLIKYLFEWGVGLGGLAVFIALIIAGVQYITSVADPGKLNEAKDRIKSSVIGLALLLSSWAIFNLINPNLNELQNINKVMEAVRMGTGGIYEARTCNTKGLYSWECCKLPATECDPATACSALPAGKNDPLCCMDEKCKPENYACCQQNDTDCISGTKSISSRLTTYGNYAKDEKCTHDHQCESRYCKCYRVDDSGKPLNTWVQKCADNPLVCLEVIGTPEAGCDFIGFYSDIDFKGSAIFVQVTSEESKWLSPPADINNVKLPDILSFQAFKAAKNRTGAGTSKFVKSDGTLTNNIDEAHKIPCGSDSCGCRVEVCDGGTTTTNSGCLRGTLIDYGTAYSRSIDPNISDVFKIYDESRSFSNMFKNMF